MKRQPLLPDEARGGVEQGPDGFHTHCALPSGSRIQRVEPLASYPDQGVGIAASTADAVAGVTASGPPRMVTRSTWLGSVNPASAAKRPGMPEPRVFGFRVR